MPIIEGRRKSIRDSVLCDLMVEILKSRLLLSQKITESKALEMKKLRARWRFRRLIRLVIENVAWLADEPDGDNIDSNIKARISKILRNSKTKPILNLFDRSLLFKSAELRTDEEKEYLNRIIGGLKCFKGYPNEVKRNLAAVTYYSHYGPGRVVVKYGQRAGALYFIVSGELAVSKPVYDHIRKKWDSVEFAVLHSGDIFGQVSLLHNILRMTTCTTITPCELLYVMKDDFKNVLKRTVQKQWDEIEAAMSRFTFFYSYDEVSIREACMLGKMKTFQRKETVLGDGIGLPNFVYFILSGRCQMIETLFISAEKQYNDIVYKLHKLKYQDQKWMNIDMKPSDDSEVVLEKPKCFNQLPDNVKVYFMQVCLLNSGGCFGLGEIMDNRRIVAKNTVKCLMLPKYWLMYRKEEKMWLRIKHFLDRGIPSTEDLYKEFLLNRKWKDHKESVVDEIIRNKKCVNYTSVHDVPYSIRIKEDMQFEFK